MHGTCFNRVTFDPSIYNGKACIKNSQVPISTIVRKLASGSSAEQLLADNPYLEDKDILQALEYAAVCVTEIDRRRQGTDLT
ncbi:DUF433 domain-containing protein [Halomonas sp. ZH2S]|uniref:DUF433 domain-containing protein n=2 Tax=Vreelandella zhuhanensis TaxID=2684210 RepID=A0A7X3KQJ6_9GAMM|nr:DUF433 domain-containing protein [Halomonas zhuhanensis]